ncbi:MAG: hypothetical protein HYV02_08160 [Deltaproteobacteria bacterium]|nr:hypothetical protein [Deltaproteobacteria bacterium]
MRKGWGIIGSLLAVLGVAAPASALDFSAHGYYRTRFHGLMNLDTQKQSALSNGRFSLIQFNQMRLRVEPTLKLNDQLSLHTQFDILDNVVFGSSTTKQLQLHDPIVGTITLPAGAGSLSLVGGAAGENGSINVRRAWMDILAPIGKFRIGRQPIHWGLGIIQNDGNSAEGDFGDTVDGVTYLVQKVFADGAGLSIGALWDIPFESQFDPRIGGLGGAVRDNGQDTNQWGLVLFYERPDFDLGFFGAFRKRDGSNGTTTTATNLAGTSVAAGIDGDTRMYILDAYGKYRAGDISIAAEYVRIGGKVSTGVALDAIPFSGLSGSGIIELPAKQDVAVNLAALEVEGNFDWGGEFIVQTGFAQGDGSPLSQRITQFGFRPSYQIGLLMFHYPLGTSPTLRDATTGTSLTGGVPITGNFINNATYGALTYKHRLDVRNVIRQANEFKVGARVLSAYAHKDPVSLDFAAFSYQSGTGGTAALPVLQSQGKWYGIEADLLVEATFFDHLKTNLEFGVFVPGSAFDINTNNPGGIIAAIPTDQAELAYGGRLSVTMEF